MKIAILGTVGVPGRYGGFETLAENLVHYHSRKHNSVELTVWCSAKDNDEKPKQFQSAKLRYIGLKANGIQSIPYDALSLLDAVRTKQDRIVLLGVSGAMMIPLIRLISKARIVTNIDGIEWKREKWNGLARAFLRASEWAAVRFSHVVIADNQSIAEHVRRSYNSDCKVIAYGGDHALVSTAKGSVPSDLPSSYSLALCRIEPENNVQMILEAWSHLEIPLVFVGNWDNSAYGRELKERYASYPNLYLLDPVYEPGDLLALRERASTYVHGHSAGGTNPSLVEMMHFGVPVLAHNCGFNRHSTEEKARYFESAEQLATLARELTPQDAKIMGAKMREIAQRRYTWESIGDAYFDTLELA